MTNKEYIKILQSLQDWLYLCSMNGGTKLQREAIDKAIEALSQPQEQIKDLAEVGTDRAVKGFPIDADDLMLRVEEKYGFRSRDRLYDIIRKMPKYELSSAQPELIHCGECKHYVFNDDRIDRFPIRGCSLTGFNDVDADDFCSRAERREVTT